MAAVAVIGGALGVASGASAIAAAGGLAAMSTGAALAAGASIVGGALAVAGGVTGNESLTKLGGVLSLGGALGGIATGTLGDPSKVFNGGGFVGEAANTASQASDVFSSPSVFDGSVGSIAGDVPMEPGWAAATNAQTTLPGVVGDTVTKLPGGWAAETPSVADAADKVLSVNKAASAASSNNTIFDKLKKYDTLLKLGGDAAKVMIQSKQQNDVLAQQQSQFNQQMDFLNKSHTAVAIPGQIGVSAPVAPVALNQIDPNRYTGILTRKV